MNRQDLIKASKRSPGDASQYRVCIGGPVYDGVHIKHCETVALLACAFAMSGWKHRVWHRRSSILVENRHSMLRDVIDNNYDIFISIDSDTYLEQETSMASAKDIVRLATQLVEDDKMSNVYAVCAPVRQSNGQWNVFVNNNHIDTMPTEPFVIDNSDNSWSAFAFAIHRVSSYWEWKDSGIPFYQFGYYPDRPLDDRWVGEDVFHSIVINKQGGKIVVAPQIKTGHR